MNEMKIINNEKKKILDLFIIVEEGVEEVTSFSSKNSTSEMTAERRATESIESGDCSFKNNRSDLCCSNAISFSDTPASFNTFIAFL